MENRGNTLILTNFVGVHPRNIYIEFEANTFSGLKGVKKVKNDYDDNKDNGHSVIARITLTHLV